MRIEWDSFRRQWRWAVLGAEDLMVYGWETTQAACQERIGDELLLRATWLSGALTQPREHVVNVAGWTPQCYDVHYVGASTVSPGQEGFAA
jgi:hypothetical protein